MGDDPPYRQVPGGVLTQGCEADHGRAYPAAIGQDLGLSSAGDGNSGSEVQRD